MSDRILGPSGSKRRRAFGLAGGKRRRRVLLGTLASTVALVAILVSNASAVHDLVFQLDGDVDTDTDTNVGGVTQTIDWQDFFGETEVPTGPLTDPPESPDPPEVTLPNTDFTAAGFHSDLLMKNQRGAVVFSSADNSTYATGSKDTLPITNPGGWQCAHSNNVGDKVDVMNAYATEYIDPGTGDEIVYFGQERNGNDGDANVGFWFLQDEDVSCESEGGGATDFTGNHTDGDVFIVSAFTQGGDVSGITVYEWIGDDSGGLGPPTEFEGADCESLPDPPPSDSACATVNKADDGPNDDGTIETPWVTANNNNADGLGHKLRTAEFFEGGVNLTALGLGGKCFSSFVSNTRSSQSLTATIFDFAAGELGQCGISTTQTWFPQDSATVTGTTGGSVTFKLYENGTCSGDPEETFVDNTPADGFSTNNTTYSISDTSGTNGTPTISWSATFTPPSESGEEPFDTTSCERSDLTINNSAGPFPPPPPTP